MGRKSCTIAPLPEQKFHYTCGPWPFDVTQCFFLLSKVNCQTVINVLIVCRGSLPSAIIFGYICIPVMLLWPLVDFLQIVLLDDIVLWYLLCLSDVLQLSGSSCTGGYMCSWPACLPSAYDGSCDLRGGEVPTRHEGCYHGATNKMGFGHCRFLWMRAGQNKKLEYLAQIQHLHSVEVLANEAFTVWC